MWMDDWNGIYMFHLFLIHLRLVGVVKGWVNE